MKSCPSITMIRNEKPHNTEILLPSNLGQAKQTKKSLVMRGVVETIETWIVSDTSRGTKMVQHFGSSLTVFIKTENTYIQ